MSIIIILFITIFLPLAQLDRPTLKLTFTPDEKYIAYQQEVVIRCELIDPNQQTAFAQLWYVDLKTGSRTTVSRSLLTSPMDQSPEIFKNNRNNRYEYLQPNTIRIRALQMEDSARYECDCPDCREVLTKKSRELLVMQLREPEWRIESGWPLHENTKAVIKCYANDFYPYVNHRILRDNKEITNLGKSALSSDKAFPQTFTWEATITPTPDWHNSTLRCTITEGNTQQETAKMLDVFFSARFLQCEERQYVDFKKEQSTIECAYSGNPAPKLLWLRQSDQKSITTDNGISINIKEEGNGRYRSIVTFDRNRINSNTSPQENSSGENYYQQLLNNGFLVRLTANGSEKGTRIITIVRNVNQVRSNSLNHSSKKSSLTSLWIILAILFFLNQC